MSKRSPRRLVVVIVTAALVVAAVVIAFRLGRATSTPPTTSTPSPSAPATPTPTYVATDRQGSAEPSLQVGPAIAGEPGTRTGPAGLPLGYSHDKTGAVNAATTYLSWMNSLRIADKETADAMATATAADPTTRDALIDSFDGVRSGLGGLTRDEPQPARGAYAVPRYSQVSALIYIWAPEVTADASGQIDHLWAIDAIKLVWADGDWKLDGGLIAMTGGAAADPLDPAGNPSAEEKHSILRRTPADPGVITDSADQTWFEYANAPH